MNSAGLAEIKARRQNLPAATSEMGGSVLMAESSGDTTFNECSFVSNTAGNGGALGIYRSGGHCTISGCNFTSNRGTEGGAIAANNSPLLAIHESSLDSNCATLDGGVIHHHGQKREQGGS